MDILQVVKMLDEVRGNVTEVVKGKPMPSTKFRPLNLYPITLIVKKSLPV